MPRDIDQKYEVYGPDGVQIGTIVKRTFYHTTTPDLAEYQLTEQGLEDMSGEMLAEWDGDDLVRLDDGVTRFTLKSCV